MKPYDRRNFVCDSGDVSPPLLKVVVTVTTTFSKWNLQFFKQYSKFHACNFTHNAATVSSRVIGLTQQEFPKQLTVHQLYYEYTSFTYLLCHSHCLTLTSKLRNKVYTVDFGMAFCPVFVMLIK